MPKKILKIFEKIAFMRHTMVGPLLWNAKMLLTFQGYSDIWKIYPKIIISEFVFTDDNENKKSKSTFKEQTKETPRIKLSWKKIIC